MADNVVTPEIYSEFVRLRKKARKLEVTKKARDAYREDVLRLKLNLADNNREIQDTNNKILANEANEGFFSGAKRFYYSRKRDSLAKENRSLAKEYQQAQYKLREATIGHEALVDRHNDLLNDMTKIKDLKGNPGLKSQYSDCMKIRNKLNRKLEKQEKQLNDVRGSNKGIEALNSKIEDLKQKRNKKKQIEKLQDKLAKKIEQERILQRKVESTRADYANFQKMMTEVKAPALEKPKSFLDILPAKMRNRRRKRDAKNELKKAKKSFEKMSKTKKNARKNLEKTEKQAIKKFGANVVNEEGLSQEISKRQKALADDPQDKKGEHKKIRSELETLNHLKDQREEFGAYKKISENLEKNPSMTLGKMIDAGRETAALEASFKLRNQARENLNASELRHAENLKNAKDPALLERQTLNCLHDKRHLQAVNNMIAKSTIPGEAGELNNNLNILKKLQNERNKAAKSVEEADRRVKNQRGKLDVTKKEIRDIEKQLKSATENAKEPDVSKQVNNLKNDLKAKQNLLAKQTDVLNKVEGNLVEQTKKLEAATSNLEKNIQKLGTPPPIQTIEQMQSEARAVSSATVPTPAPPSEKTREQETEDKRVAEERERQKQEQSDLAEKDTTKPQNISSPNSPVNSQNTNNQEELQAAIERDQTQVKEMQKGVELNAQMGQQQQQMQEQQQQLQQERQQAQEEHEILQTREEAREEDRAIASTPRPNPTERQDEEEAEEEQEELQRQEEQKQQEESQTEENEESESQTELNSQLPEIQEESQQLQEEIQGLGSEAQKPAQALQEDPTLTEEVSVGSNTSPPVLQSQTEPVPSVKETTPAAPTAPTSLQDSGELGSAKDQPELEDQEPKGAENQTSGKEQPKDEEGPSKPTGEGFRDFGSSLGGASPEKNKKPEEKPEPKDKEPEEATALSSEETDPSQENDITATEKPDTTEQESQRAQTTIDSSSPTPTLSGDDTGLAAAVESDREPKKAENQTSKKGPKDEEEQPKQSKPGEGFEGFGKSIFGDVPEQAKKPEPKGKVPEEVTALKPKDKVPTTGLANSNQSALKPEPPKEDGIVINQKPGGGTSVTITGRSGAVVKNGVVQNQGETSVKSEANLTSGSAAERGARKEIDKPTQRLQERNKREARPPRPPRPARPARPEKPTPLMSGSGPSTSSDNSRGDTLIVPSTGGKVVVKVDDVKTRERGGKLEITSGEQTVTVDSPTRGNTLEVRKDSNGKLEVVNTTPTPAPQSDQRSTESPQESPQSPPAKVASQDRLRPSPTPSNKPMSGGGGTVTRFENVDNTSVKNGVIQNPGETSAKQGQPDTTPTNNFANRWSQSESSLNSFKESGTDVGDNANKVTENGKTTLFSSNGKELTTGKGKGTLKQDAVAKQEPVTPASTQEGTQIRRQANSPRP